ncbi:response regulator [Janthinobacterium sp. 78]|uniref:response regulator n=1 Tax=Janthinobacterium sp. 78 TaxID=2135631 RepID=UPI000E317924|nr:response regulator [Janthinobacterium sp. 78]
MSLEILFIEDNPHKRLRTAEFVTSLNSKINITEACSFTSGIQALENKNFPLILLDISLPTYDKIASEAGGRFRTLAGREIARKIMREKINSKIIFITQYATFSDKGASYTFEELKIELSKECGPQFAGMVFYDSSQSAWKETIMKVIKAMME